MIRIELPHTEYTNSLRDLRDSGIAFISSVYTFDSVTIPKWQTKLVNLANTSKFEGKNLLPGEAAKIVLSDHVKQQKIYPGTIQIPPPHFYRHQFDGNVWYIDVKSAYASIYRQHEAELYFDFKKIWRGYTELYPVYERLKDFKPARNAVPGIMLSSQFAVNKGYNRSVIKKPTRFYNPNVYNLCNYYMHRIARIAADAGRAIYWNTDGGFVLKAEPVIEIIEKFCMDYRIELGRLKLGAWNNFSFTNANGFSRTVGHPERDHKFCGEIDNVAYFD